MSNGSGAGGPNLISVRTELVAEQLIARIFEAVVDRYPGEVPASLEPAFDAARESVVGPGKYARPQEPVTELARKLARSGYLTRVVESELFEPARRPLPWLAERLQESFDADEDSSWIDAVVETSRDLADADPLERPDPSDERAASWRVPGPGGHVRHYLVGHMVRHFAEKGSDGDPELPKGVEGPAQLKRCWLYGFYLRCCEEALPAQASLD